MSAVFLKKSTSAASSIAPSPFRPGGLSFTLFKYLSTPSKTRLPRPIRQTPGRRNLNTTSIMSSPSTTTTSLPPRFKLFFTVPTSSLDACKEAVFATGAGTYPGGKYAKACFETPGTGHFLPMGGANPNIGSVGILETVEEVKVEVLCLGREVMVKAVEALRKAHPYEEPAYEVYKLEEI